MAAFIFVAHSIPVQNHASGSLESARLSTNSSRPSTISSSNSGPSAPSTRSRKSSGESAPSLPVTFRGRKISSPLPSPEIEWQVKETYEAATRPPPPPPLPPCSVAMDTTEDQLMEMYHLIEDIGDYSIIDESAGPAIRESYHSGQLSSGEPDTPLLPSPLHPKLATITEKDAEGKGDEFQPLETPQNINEGAEIGYSFPHSPPHFSSPLCPAPSSPLSLSSRYTMSTADSGTAFSPASMDSTFSTNTVLSTNTQGSVRNKTILKGSPLAQMEKNLKEKESDVEVDLDTDREVDKVAKEGPSGGLNKPKEKKNGGQLWKGLKTKKSTPNLKAFFSGLKKNEPEEDDALTPLDGGSILWKDED